MVPDLKGASVCPRMKSESQMLQWYLPISLRTVDLLLLPLSSRFSTRKDMYFRKEGA